MQINVLEQDCEVSAKMWWALQEISNETKANEHHCNIKVGLEIIVQEIIQALLEKHWGQGNYG